MNDAIFTKYLDEENRKAFRINPMPLHNQCMTSKNMNHSNSFKRQKKKNVSSHMRDI